MSDDELAGYVLLGREERHVEYKEARPWVELAPKIAKSAMALANLPGGGVVVVGMRRLDDSYEAAGVDAELARGFVEDDIHAFVNRYAEPFVDLSVRSVPHDGRLFVIVVVEPFLEVPVICRRDGDGLRQGAIYVRSRRMRETTEIRHSADMRELIDFATERALASYRRKRIAEDGGEQSNLASSDAERFDLEARGL